MVVDWKEMDGSTSSSSSTENVKIGGLMREKPSVSFSAEIHVNGTSLPFELNVGVRTPIPHNIFCRA